MLLRTSRSYRLLPLCAVLAAPGAAFAAFAEAPLTNTSQILAPANPGDVLAGVDFRYPGQGNPGGTVSGIAFQEVNPLAGPTPLTGGGTVDLTGAGGDDDRSRSQNSAPTISGADQAALEAIADTINFVGLGETTNLVFTGLPVSTPVQVQLIGGDAGSGFQNWFGAFDITANGTAVNPGDPWNAADDVDTTASLATFDAVTDAAGGLTLSLTNNRPIEPGSNGSFAGIGGAVVAVPEPTSLAALALGGLLALRRRRRGA